MTLSDVFDLYNVQYKFRNRKIIIDDEEIVYPETLFISKDEIDKLTVINAGTNSTIQILLKGYTKRKKNENDYRKL